MGAGVVKVPEDGPVVLSACLAGVACTHQARPQTRQWAIDLVASGRAVTVCPEVAGGLPIPRPAAEIRGGDGAEVLDGGARVVDERGDDVTDAYLAGAARAAEAARTAGAQLAILKARSPSCGCRRIYDGSFSHMLKDGEGVTAALLRRDGLTVVDDEEIE